MEKFIEIVDDATMKTSEIIAKMRELFPVLVDDEENLNENFPAPETLTSRKFLLKKEANEKLKNPSADDLLEKGILDITLRERLLLELKYFKKTQKHLDVKNVTICLGSRGSDGLAPVVYCVAGRVCVSWRIPRRGHLCSRKAIS